MSLQQSRESAGEPEVELATSSGPVQSTGTKAKQVAIWCLDALWIVIPLLFGASVPSFYDWTGADQSRPSIWISVVVFGPIVVAAFTTIALPLWPNRWNPFPSPGAAEKSHLRFSIANLLIATSLFALLTATYSIRPQVIAVAFLGCTYLAAFILAFGGTAKLWKVTQALSCLLLPSVWVLWFGSSLGDYSERLVPWFGFFPALFPSMLIGRLLGDSNPDSPLAILLTGIILGSCIFAAASGNSKFYRLILVWVCAITFSSSMILNALVRM
ncbi:MAG: hypothetical protein ACE361_19795 [Aureliella sp.]